MSSVRPIQLYRPQQPAKVVRPWSPVPVPVAPKASLIPADLRGPRVLHRRTDKAIFPRPPEAERQVFRSLTRIQMKDTGTLRSLEPSPRIFVRARLVHLLKEGAVFAFSVVGFVAGIGAVLLAMGPR